MWILNEQRDEMTIPIFSNHQPPKPSFFSIQKHNSLGKKNLPEKQSVEVSFFRVKCLVLHSSQPKANDQHRKGEGEKPWDDKNYCPCIKPYEIKNKMILALKCVTFHFIATVIMHSSLAYCQSIPNSASRDLIYQSLRMHIFPVMLKAEINHLVFDKQVCIKYWMFETN